MYGTTVTTLYVCEIHGCRYRDPANAADDCGTVRPVVFTDDVI